MRKLYFSIMIIGLAGCGLFHKKDQTNQNENQTTSSTSNTKDSVYTSVIFKGNYVWGSAMNLAWNELCDNIISGDLKFSTTDVNAIETTNKLNKRIFTKSYLDEASYYVKSGYGQQTVNAINAECRAKFPDKSFHDLNMQLEPEDIISYAYFLKKVSYLVQFHEMETIKFLDSAVKGFETTIPAHRRNVEILDYRDKDNFIIALYLQEDTDEIILAKGYAMENPMDILNDIKKHNDNRMPMNEVDYFAMPVLHLDMNRQYKEMLGKRIQNKGFERYVIGEMYENLKFDMDHKGARVENEAVIGIRLTSVPNPEVVPKRMVMDKAFWVIMKQKNAPQPYFMLGVNNVALMKKG